MSALDSIWSSWQPATCMPDACFCEAIHPGVIAQPANTWSNLAFVLVGLLVIAQGRSDAVRNRRFNLMTRRAAYGIVYGAACIVIGLGSLFYHASLTFVGQFFDVMGMYLLGAFVLLYALARLSTLSPGRFVAGYVGLNAVLAYVLIASPSLRRWLFAAVLIAALALEFRASRLSTAIDRRFLRAAVLALAAAFAIWILDLTKVLCAPQSWLQGHAAWHVLCAAAAGMGHLYYRSERAAATGYLM